jgi:hypothetical protein
MISFLAAEKQNFEMVVQFCCTDELTFTRNIPFVGKIHRLRNMGLAKSLRPTNTNNKYDKYKTTKQF